MFMCCINICSYVSTLNNKLHNAFDRSTYALPQFDLENFIAQSSCTMLCSLRRVRWFQRCDWWMSKNNPIFPSLPPHSPQLCVAHKRRLRLVVPRPRKRKVPVSDHLTHGPPYLGAKLARCEVPFHGSNRMSNMCHPYLAAVQCMGAAGVSWKLFLNPSYTPWHPERTLRARMSRSLEVTADWSINRTRWDQPAETRSRTRKANGRWDTVHNFVVQVHVEPAEVLLRNSALWPDRAAFPMKWETRAWLRMSHRCRALVLLWAELVRGLHWCIVSSVTWRTPVRSLSRMLDVLSNRLPVVDDDEQSGSGRLNLPSILSVPRSVVCVFARVCISVGNG